MSYTTWSLVYGEQPSTAKWNILGTNDAHFYGFLGDNLEWQSWTPTLTNMSKGNGTINAYYTQVGNTVFARFAFLLGNTSTVGTNPTFTAPVTQLSDAAREIGGCMLEDATAGSWLGGLQFNAAGSAILISAFASAGTYVTRAAVTSTVPFTWTTNDWIAGNFSYEAA